jgi:hypothetical protein
MEGKSGQAAPVVYYRKSSVRYEITCAVLRLRVLRVFRERVRTVDTFQTDDALARHAAERVVDRTVFHD